MSATRPTLTLLLLGSFLPAQLPAPPLSIFGPTSLPVGGFNLLQAGYSLPGTQAVWAYCDQQWWRPGTATTPPAIGIGGTVYYVGESMTPSGSPAFYPPGTVLSAFAIAPLTAAHWVMPIAAAGHDVLVVDTSIGIVSGPLHQETYTSDLWVLPLAIPNNPALIGTLWQAQSFRVDPSNGLFYMSNGLLVEVTA